VELSSADALPTIDFSYEQPPPTTTKLLLSDDMICYTIFKTVSRSFIWDCFQVQRFFRPANRKGPYGLNGWQASRHFDCMIDAFLCRLLGGWLDLLTGEKVSLDKIGIIHDGGCSWMLCEGDVPIQAT